MLHLSFFVLVIHVFLYLWLHRRYYHSEMKKKNMFSICISLVFFVPLQPIIKYSYKNDNKTIDVMGLFDDVGPDGKCCSPYSGTDERGSCQGD